MPDIGLGYQLITQDQVFDSSTTVVDLDVPAGKVVIASGIGADSIGGYGTAFKPADGPHPTDPAKWRFTVSTGLENGGNGYAETVRIWMIVVNAAAG